MKIVTTFDRPYSNEKQAEGIGIMLAVISGECDKCSCLKQCESDGTFKPADDMPCMIHKRAFLKENTKAN